MKRVAWVTGASSGVGLGSAKALAEAGFAVVLSARNEKNLAEASRAVGGDYRVVDVANPQAVREVVNDIEAQYGRIDVLVANAGMNVAARAWGEVSHADFDKLVSVNLNGVFYCIDAVLPGMRARKDGTVITVASWAGRLPSAMAGPGYVAAKHGAVAMTHTLNMTEFKNGIRACSLCPGEIATSAMSRRKNPPSPEVLDRMLTVEDVARVVRFVAETPARMCVNEILFSPTWNMAYAR